MTSQDASEFEAILYEALEKAAEDADLDEAPYRELIAAGVHDTRVELAKAVLDELCRRAPAMLRDRRGRQKRFEKRAFRRWKPAFDLFEMMIVIAEELGEETDRTLRPQAVKDQDYKFEAHAHLHARAVLVAREILCLLRGGYPDGALARWRALHELTVTAMYIAQEDQQTALRYLASFAFQALRAAKQYNKHAERAKLTPFTEEELRQQDEAANAAERQIGRRLKRDYDWARPDSSTDDFTFAKLEELTGMDHWRPRYRWASQHTHAGHRPSDRMLGLCEADEPMFLVGASNSGFTDPLHMTAISLTQMTTTFLVHAVNFDRLVFADIMKQLADELGPVAQKVERETLAAHQSDN